MALIYETKNFIVESHEHPFIDREEGGHIRIMPKVTVADRTKLSPELAKEFIKLTMVIGEAFPIAMHQQGIEISRVNYQDMGNRVPVFHMHIFGRVKGAKIQEYGEALSLPKKETGFYDTFKPLTDEDIALIRKEIERLLETEKYKNF